jgi:hypothetical protein
MKHIVLAIALSLTVSGVAQESSSAAPVDFAKYTQNQPLVTPRDPSYFGEIKKPDHHVRNRVIIGSAIAAGVVATVFLTHSSTATTQPFVQAPGRVIHGVIR